MLIQIYTERNFQTATRHFSIYLNIYDTYMAKITLNMEKLIKQILSKFHFHKLKITCSIDRLYKGTIAFHFHTNARIWAPRLKPSIQGTSSEKHHFYGVINGHYWTFLGFAFIKKQFSGNPQCSYGSPYGIKKHKNALWRWHVFVHNITEAFWCCKWTLLNTIVFIL